MSTIIVSNGGELRVEGDVSVGNSAFQGTTWNQLDKTAGITLSNGDLTAFQPGSSFHQVRTVSNRTTGLYYWENNIDVNGGAQQYLGTKIAAAS